MKRRCSPPRSALVASCLLIGLAASPAGAEDKKGPAKSPESAAFEDAVADMGAPVAPARPSGVLGSKRMRKANEVAAEMVKRRLRNRGDDLELLSRAGAADVVVVAGTYDRAQDALKAMGVHHVVIRPHHLARLDLLATQTLLVNCPGTMSKAGREKIASFVRRGGFLVTTDWALKNLVQRVFPRTIRHNGIETRDDVVKVQVHDHKHEELLAGIQLAKDDPKWWLESASYPIKIVDKDVVKVLMSSTQMGKRYGQSAIAVSFPYDDGRVLHLTSHFYLQRSEASRGTGSTLASKSGLSKKELAAMKARGVNADAVSEGELNSAYSMQQFSSNIIVSKQRANKTLLKKFDKTTSRDLQLRGDSAPGKGQKAKTMRKGYRVKVLDTRGDEVKVQDLFGNEGWVPADAL